MINSRHRQLVEQASQRRLYKTLDEAFEHPRFNGSVQVWLRELDAVNRHITVDAKEIASASEAYQKLAQKLVATLHWPEDVVKILPQGSCSTKTLIRSPDASKFDVDAVCRVDISRVEARDPMKFYEDIGAALKSFGAIPKKRCWCIEFPNERYYIDLTPSAPLSTLSVQELSHVQYRSVSQYAHTALGVVDTPTRKWKTSNPEGFATWVNTQAARKLLYSSIVLDEVLSKRADIIDVPEQTVPLGDTLRVAIRLFKRHRDAAVAKGLLRAEHKPISVVIVTLLTQCYEGLADMGRVYQHPVKLLIDLAELLPSMVEDRDGTLWIANPTVEGENFAERWKDNAACHSAFLHWCKLLNQDLTEILSAQTEAKVRDLVRNAFACTNAASSTLPPIGPIEGGSGLAQGRPSNVSRVPATTGLA